MEKRPPTLGQCVLWRTKVVVESSLLQLMGVLTKSVRSQMGSGIGQILSDHAHTNFQGFVPI